MKRGLKELERRRNVGECLVEEYSPMKRGLKVRAQGVVHGGIPVVEEYSPMKRGLKESGRLLPVDFEPALKSIPR